MAGDNDTNIGAVMGAIDALARLKALPGASSTPEQEKIGQNINNSSLFGVGAEEPPPVKPIPGGNEKRRLENETKIIAKIWFTLKKKFQPDVKGKTTTVKRKTKEVKEVKKKDDKGKGKGLLGWLLGGLGALLMGKFGLKGLLKLLGKGIWGLLKLIVKGIWGAFKLAFKGLGWFFSKMFGAFKNSKIWTSLTKGLQAGVTAIKGIFLAAKGAIGSALKAIGGFFTTIFSSIPGISKLFPSLAAGAGIKAGSAAAKAAEAAAKKKAAAKAGGGAAKVMGKAGLKTALKKIPFGIGALFGLGFGAYRLMKGDVTGAAMEVASGAASIVPGVGTVASLGIDATIIARDIKKAKTAPGINDGYINKNGKVTSIADTDQALLFAEKGPLSNIFKIAQERMVDVPKDTSALVNRNQSAFNIALRNVGRAISALGKGIRAVAKGLLGTRDITDEIKTSNQYLSKLVSGHAWNGATRPEASGGVPVTGSTGPRDPISQVVHNTNIGGKVAKLHLLQQKLSNKHLQRLVELTGELVKKGTGGAPAVLPAIAGPLPPNNELTGDMSGPTYSDSRADFYHSAYSMHTPGLPA